jgi:hypothetical protein
MNKRPPEPEFVKVWREGPPKCCHTCEYFNEEGHCTGFDLKPPDDFAATKDACEMWLYEVPF